jgi:iron complex outermembrane receptor protein
VPGEGGQKANLSLRPERIRSRELVLEHYFSPTNRLTAHLFRNTVTNLISLTRVADTNPTVAAEAGEQLQFQNIDSVRGHGAGLEYEHLWAGGAKLRTSIVQQHTVDGTSGATLVNSPRRLLKFNLSTPLAHDAWQAGFEAQYVGRRKTLTAAVGGYWLANLSLFSAHLAKGTELTASIYNLFGRRYADPGSEEHAQDAIAQDGRTFRVKLSYGF